MGAPHVFPKVYEFLKSRPNEAFTPRQIGAAIGHASDINSAIKTLMRNRTSTVKRLPIGTGRLAKYMYKKSVGTPRPAASQPSTPTPAPAPAPATREIVMITVALDGRDVDLSASEARKIYDQLRILFGE